jgi:hypothetical protein
MVHIRATRGKCPNCNISLIYETIRERPATVGPRSSLAQPEPPDRLLQPAEIPGENKMLNGQTHTGETVLQEKVEISQIERMVDAMGREGTMAKASISDIAVIDALAPDTGHASIEKKVDRVLRSKSKSRG